MTRTAKQPTSSFEGNATRSTGRRLVAVLGLAVALSTLPSVGATASPGGAERCLPNPGNVVPPGCPEVVDDVKHEVLPDTLPNLVPEPPAIVLPRTVDGLRAVAFDTVIVNRGDYALDLLHEPVADADPLLSEWSAAQCVGWVGVVCRERRNVGEFVYHSAPGHEHYHFEAFALYELRRLTTDGGPDLSSGGLVGDGEKVSFCLQDTRRVDREAFPRAFYTGCGRLYQGISAGWADIYGAHLQGQHLSVDGVPDGRYALVFTVDPDSRLFESDDTDNVSWSVIELSEDGTAVEVVAGA